MSDRKYDDVLEKHRLLRGAEQMSVTIDGNPTPEELDAELTALDAVMDEYESFSETERLHATLNTCKNKVRGLRKLAEAGYDETKTVDELRAALRDIWGKADMFWMGDMDGEVKFMKAQAEKGQAASPSA